MVGQATQTIKQVVHPEISQVDDVESRPVGVQVLPCESHKCPVKARGSSDDRDVPRFRKQPQRSIDRLGRLELEPGACKARIGRKLSRQLLYAATKDDRSLKEERC